MLLNEEKLAEEVKTLLEEDSEVLEQCVNSINSYDGSFEQEIWYDMEMLDEYLSGMSAWEVLRLGFYGSDEYEEKSFNPMRNYFRFNGYGNLESCDYIDYSDLIDDVVSLVATEDYDQYDLPEELEELIKSYNYDSSFQLDEVNDMKLIEDEIMDYNVIIDNDTIYFNFDDGDDIENILIDNEIEYC